MFSHIYRDGLNKAAYDVHLGMVLQSTDTYYWSDGSEVTYVAWDGGHPREGRPFCKLDTRTLKFQSGFAGRTGMVLCMEISGKMIYLW